GDEVPLVEGGTGVGEAQLDDVADLQGRVRVVDEEVVVVELDCGQTYERLPRSVAVPDAQQDRQVHVDGDVALAHRGQRSPGLRCRVHACVCGECRAEGVRRGTGAKGGAALVGLVVVGDDASGADDAAHRSAESVDGGERVGGQIGEGTASGGDDHLVA